MAVVAKLRIMLLLLGALSGAATLPRLRVGGATPGANFTFLDNGIITVGIDTAHGASIGWFSPSGGTNLVNNHDTGR
jgi:hypothetical protein